MVHFSGISPDILDRFSESFYHMKALYKQMMDLYHIFQFVKGRCHGNQTMLQKTLSKPTDTSCIYCTDARKQTAISRSSSAY